MGKPKAKRKNRRNKRIQLFTKRELLQIIDHPESSPKTIQKAMALLRELPRQQRLNKEEWRKLRG